MGSLYWGRVSEGKRYVERDAEEGVGGFADVLIREARRGLQFRAALVGAMNEVWMAALSGWAGARRWLRFCSQGWGNFPGFLFLPLESKQGVAFRQQFLFLSSNFPREKKKGRCSRAFLSVSCWSEAKISWEFGYLGRFAGCRKTKSSRGAI